MKKILLFLPVILMGFEAVAQKQIVASGDPVFCESTIRVESNVNQNLLYAKSRAWAAAWYKGADEVIGARDKYDSSIVGKSFFTTVLRLGGLYGTKRYRVNYSYKLFFKNGQSTIVLSDFFPDRHPVLKDGRIVQYQSIFGRRIARRTYAGLIEASKNYSAAVIKSYTDYLMRQSKAVSYSKTDDSKVKFYSAAPLLK